MPLPFLVTGAALRIERDLRELDRNGRANDRKVRPPREKVCENDTRTRISEHLGANSVERRATARNSQRI